MDPNLLVFWAFLIIVFCLTAITLAAMSQGKDKLAEKATDALTNLASEALEIVNQPKDKTGD